MENKAYLLLLASDHCHDMDEWLGIYTDTEKLKQDYKKACAEMDECCGDSYYRCVKVKIYEFDLNKYINWRNFEDADEIKVEDLSQKEAPNA